MTELSTLDRLYCANARFIERPMLALVASQRVLRVLFAATAWIGARLPAGTEVIRAPDGSLWLTPPGVAEDAPYLIYIHGGGFTVGSPGTHKAMAAHIAAAAGLRVFLPRYPLAPEHPFPAAAEAMLTTYRRLCRDHGRPAAIAGDSAGGNLSLVTLMQARDAGLPLPRAMGLIAPVADMTGALEARFAAAKAEYLIPPAWPRRIERAFLRDADPADPRVSPLLGDLSGLPPTLLQAADGEALAEDARRLAETLPEARLDLWAGLQHVWHLKAGSGHAATRACREMGAFLAEKASVPDA